MAVICCDRIGGFEGFEASDLWRSDLCRPIFGWSCSQPGFFSAKNSLEIDDFPGRPKAHGNHGWSDPEELPMTVLQAVPTHLWPSLLVKKTLMCHCCVTDASSFPSISLVFLLQQQHSAASQAMCLAASWKTWWTTSSPRRARSRRQKRRNPRPPARTFNSSTLEESLRLKFSEVSNRYSVYNIYI